MFRKNQPQAVNGFVRDTSHRPSISKGPILTILALLIFGMLAIPLLQENGIGAWFRLQDEEQALSAEVTALEDANENLAQSIEAVKNDPATLEKLAREEFNMHLPGEKVVLVVDEKPIQN
jgi:cell division protein FtsB